MCGIAGVIIADKPLGEAAVRRMNLFQRHRGPDDEGLDAILLPHGHLILGQRRLAILDLSSAGHQPMHNSETGDWLVFNGEIYNFLDLRKQLEVEGTQFRSRCDTEVILHAYARWGGNCFARFHGMFALALYDARARQLILARDPLGIKPLYVAQAQGALAFASELKTLIRSGLIKKDLDQRGLAGLLAYGSVQGPLTLIREVRLLEPGTWEKFDLDGTEPWRASISRHRFWNFPQPSARLREDEVHEQLHSRLEDAVRSHLISDVPVGLFLSGGIDSNALAALAASQDRQKVTAFNIALDGHSSINEGPIAASISNDLGLPFHPVTLTNAEVLGQVERFLTCVDQPTIDGLNTYIISKAVRERGIAVALSGLGGDEIFAGYSTFREVPRMASWHRLAAWIPAQVRRGMAACIYHGQPLARRYKAVEMASKPSGLRSFYFRRRRLLSDREINALGYSAEALGLDEDFLAPECYPAQNLAESDAVAAVSILESHFYMGNTLLRDADVFGMAHGLEIRVPLLDRRVVDLGYSLPGAMRVSGRGPNKPVLVGAMGAKLRPDLARLSKRGFGLPMAHWMAGPLREVFEHFVKIPSYYQVLDSRASFGVWQEFLRDQTGPTWSRAWLLGILGSWLQDTLGDTQL